MEPSIHAVDPFDLRRFVLAQTPTWGEITTELAAGEKRSHWMWFVFPQLRGLGASAMAARYGISGLEEARSFLIHPVLGPRLQTATSQLLVHRGRSARDILGVPDDLKLCSSMTLFACAASGPTVFADVLDAFFAGRRDPRTLALLLQPPAADPS